MGQRIGACQDLCPALPLFAPEYFKLEIVQQRWYLLVEEIGQKVTVSDH